MIRAVLDANVFVSALIRPGGPPGQIIYRLMQDRAFHLIISPDILEETRQALRRPRLKRYISVSDEEREQFLGDLEVVGDPCSGTGRRVSIPADPDDEIYVAAAIEGLATHLVSGDRHLPGLPVTEGFAIVTPRQFLDVLKEVNRWGRAVVRWCGGAAPPSPGPLEG